jgi:hypothetical protein
MKRLKLCALALLPVSAFATTDPYEAITGVSDWTAMGIDAVLVGVALSTCFVVLRGIRMLVSFVRR